MNGWFLVLLVAMVSMTWIVDGHLSRMDKDLIDLASKLDELTDEVKDIKIILEKKFYGSD